MLYIRHYSTVDKADSAWWKYDAVRKVVFLALPRDACGVDVCSLADPRYSAFPVHRVDATTWKIAPTRFTQRGPKGELIAVASPIGDAVGREFVFLLDAPERVSVELARLG